jgi:hypothetical protein
MATISGKGAWAGASVLFTSAMLLVIGIFDVIQGLVALFRDDVYVIGSSGLVLSTDWTTWGWGLIAWGAVLVLASASLYAGGAFGRWFSIVAVGINMIAQFAFFPAYPLWSVIVVGVSVVVLWALTFGWRDATSDLG